MHCQVILFFFLADPYIAAEEFLSANNLPGYYLDNVAEFIIQNAGIGTKSSSTMGAADPFTGICCHKV